MNGYFVKQNYSSMKAAKLRLNVSEHSWAKTFTGVSFLTNIVAACNLNLPLFQTSFRQWYFPDFTNNIFKERCYKKKRNVIRNVDQISIANLITHLFI